MSKFGNPLFARVAVRRAATGLCAVDVLDGYRVRTYRGFLTESAARSTGRLVAETIGRVPYFV
jgi:hypothetical protein